MIKIGIDVHGVADTIPHLFSELSRVLVGQGHEVHILTGAEQTPELEYELRNVLGLSWTHFFSTTTHHKIAGTKITYIDGNPYMDNKIWNRAKAEYCKMHGIQLHIDDSDVYGKYFETPYARFETMRTDELLVHTDQPQTTMGQNEIAENAIIPPAMTTPALTVDIAICTIIDSQLHVLLTKRDFPPFKDHWAIPGGFIDIENKESLEAAAARKLHEKTGLKNLYVEQLKTYGDVERDPRSRVVTTVYFALVNYDLVKDQKPANTRWLPLKNIEVTLLQNKSKLAFDHALILKDLSKRLQKKITYTPIAFDLLSETFTWPELRTVYEAVLDKPLDPANFKKKIRSQYRISEHKARKTPKSAGRPPVYISFEGVKDQYI